MVGENLELKIKPHWHEVQPEKRLIFLQRIAAAGSRAINRQLGVSDDHSRRNEHRISGVEIHHADAEVGR